MRASVLSPPAATLHSAIYNFTQIIYDLATSHRRASSLFSHLIKIVYL